jgi:hypothetical protein
MIVSRTITKTAARCALALAVAVVSTTAAAATQFDPSTGIGEVAKTDVQAAFGWNNAQLQLLHAGITFSYEAHVNHAAVCTFPVAKGVASETFFHVTSSGVNVDSNSDLHKTTKQVTRFNLIGLGDTTFQSGSLPEISSRCRSSNGARGFWTSVGRAATGSTGGLFANYGTTKVQISWP